MGIETKICSKCKKTISIDDFHHTRKGNIKRRAWCKTCDRDYHIQYYLTHQEEHKKASVEYRNQKKSENPLLVWCQASIKSHKIRSKYLV
jgi:recombinational DNA repair protein (RecF pathway)